MLLNLSCSFKVYIIYIRNLKADDKTAGQSHQFPKHFGTSQQTFLLFLFRQGFRSVTFLLLRYAQVFWEGQVNLVQSSSSLYICMWRPNLEEDWAKLLCPSQNILTLPLKSVDFNFKRRHPYYLNIVFHICTFNWI